MTLYHYVYNLMFKILDVLRGASGEGVGHPTPFITEIDYLEKMFKTHVTLYINCVLCNNARQKNSCCRKTMYVKLNLKCRLHFRFMQTSGTVYILATNMPYGLFKL